MRSVCFVHAFSHPTVRFIFRCQQFNRILRLSFLLLVHQTSLHKDPAFSLPSTASLPRFLSCSNFLVLERSAFNFSLMESDSRRLKRERDEEKPSEEEDCFSAAKHRRSLSDLLSRDDDDAAFAAEDADYDQELISYVMKSLADEIRGSNPSSETLPCVCDSASIIHVASDENVCNAAPNVDLEFLLGATDDELGIPPSPHCLSEAINGVAAEIPAENLFETPRAESPVEVILPFPDSDCWNVSYEYEAAMLNDSLCVEWQTKSLQGEAISDCYGPLSMDKTRVQLLESGVGM